MAIQLAKASVVLFQGDSITDCGRGREGTAPNLALGHGYASGVAGWLLAHKPSLGLSIFNRGISGNRIVDLAARVKSDVINLRPDVLSILIGVNDTWHEFGGRCNGVAVPKYTRVFREFLTEVKEALPAIQLVLCEPFVLPCGVVTGEWVAEMDQRRAAVATLSREFGAVFIPFQNLFDEAMKEAPAPYWAADGVHPTEAGHTRMAEAWIRGTGL